MYFKKPSRQPGPGQRSKARQERKENHKSPFIPLCQRLFIPLSRFDRDQIFVAHKIQGTTAYWGSHLTFVPESSYFYHRWWPSSKRRRKDARALARSNLLT